jgi:hypothetical protein
VNTPERDLALQRQRLEQKFRAITKAHLGADRAESLIAGVVVPAADRDIFNTCGSANLGRLRSRG